METITQGNNIDVLRRFVEEGVQVDALITDPPYGLRLMNTQWDYDVPTVEFWQLCLQVLKPGAHVLSFGGTRTYHRLVTNIEDAGFEIRDQLMWLYSNGRPNGLAVGEGLNTTLKPAVEPIVLARKPISEATIKANVSKHGTGALNVDACRVGTEGGCRHDGTPAQVDNANHVYGTGIDARHSPPVPGLGRYPSNVIVDEDAAGLLDDAARFFYCAKASKKERGDSKHPTIKPIALMRYLCRLITPKGGLVLDPFAGSGTTGEACLLEGFVPLLIEMDSEYVEDIKKRLHAFVVV